jgi:hypothetical protein
MVQSTAHHFELLSEAVTQQPKENVLDLAKVTKKERVMKKGRR